MRENIGLFRGKRIGTDEWAEGSLHIEWGETISDGHREKDYRILGMRGECYYVDPDTVGECTGLTDKNGKQIFEGDILRIAQTGNGMGDYYFPPVEYPVKVVVCWDMCAWLWETLCEDKRFISFPTAWCHYECEIIGNIHDNKELLNEN